ncbi:MAG: prolyl oligopeptidase family serine peptidase [Flavobacteriales bacterium]|nr:prolyl oligopeptidase family serine peptidase [Flavobacteriales bacterium]
MRSLVLLVLVGLAAQLTAQDGKLLERTPYTVPDSSIAKWRSRMPDVDTILTGVRISRITYLSDGLKVNGYMAVPTGNGPFPSVVFCRGGNREIGPLDDGAILRYLANMASRGYVVVGTAYRGNDGGEGKEEFGGADVNDVLNLLPLLEEVPEADTSRIGIFGGSRGGMMAYLALARTTRFKAAIIRSGLSDSFMALADRPALEQNVYAQLIPGFTANRDSLLLTRSPGRWAERLCKTTPILIQAGTGDNRVKADQAIAMAQALYACKHPFRMLMLEGADHYFTEYRDEVDHATRLFLDTYVRDGKPWPSLVPHGE